MATILELESDRDLLNAVLKRMAAADGSTVLDAIGKLSEARATAVVRHGPDASVEQTLEAAGAPFTLSMAQGDVDSGVRALAVAQSSTSGPVGSRTDAQGRVELSDALAAKVLADDELAARRWLEAKKLGLPGSQSRADWTQRDRQHASCGVDLLSTLRLEHEARHAASAPRRKGAVVEVAPQHPWAGTNAPPGKPKRLERPATPYDGALKILQDHRRENPEAYGPKPARKEGRVIALSKDGVPETFMVGPYRLADA